MAESLTAGQIIAIVALAAVCLFAMPYILKLLCSVCPALFEYIGGIFDDWREAWREFLDEFKELFKG